MSKLENQKIASRLVRIPQMWIAGFVRNGATVLQAIKHWETQEILRRKFNAELES